MFVKHVRKVGLLSSEKYCLNSVLTNGLIVGAILETLFNSLLQDNQF